MSLLLTFFLSCCSKIHNCNSAALFQPYPGALALPARPCSDSERGLELQVQELAHTSDCSADFGYPLVLGL